jgi:CPA2 family monovalent cation:H+ antiporter-2
MQHLEPLIKDLAIILGVAGIITLLFQRIKQPVVLGYLVAGIIIGPYTPPYSFIHDVPNIKILAELGVIFLMFSLGLEFSFHKLVRVGFSASITALVEVIFMLCLGFMTGKLMGWTFYDSLFLGAALSISSTTIIIKAINELGLTKKRFAELVFGILIVEDLLAVLLLVALSTVVLTNSLLSLDIAHAAVKLIIVVGAWFIIGYFLIPTLFRKVIHYVSDETLTVVSVGLCLFLVALAAHFHYSAALGAFIMGSILAETHIIHRIEHLIRPIRDIFAAVFFVSVGMLMNPTVIVHQWPALLLIAGVTIVGKLLSSSLGALATGQSLNTSLRTGFSLAQIGEFSFIIVALGASLNVISSSLYPLVVAVSCLTTFTTPYLIHLSNYLAKKLNEGLPISVKNSLDNYSAFVYRFTSGNADTSTSRGTLIRFIVNGIIIAIIFGLCDNFLLPWLIKVLNKDWLAKAYSWLGALFIASPFIWGMVFADKAIAHEKPQARTVKSLFMCLLVVIELFILSLVYFDTWVVLIPLVLLAAWIFIFSYKRLANTYHWFEQRLIKNIKRAPTDTKRYEQLAPWDTHIVELEVTAQAPFAGKYIHECQPRQKFNINIVAIHRYHRTILAPRGSEILQPHDKLIVLGNDEQIEAFRKFIEVAAIQPMTETEDHLANFTLTAFNLTANNPLTGKTIRESKIREQVYGLIVGIERNGERLLNPDPAERMLEGDIVFIVGDVEHLKQIVT